jgi:hypothetical protein
VSLQSVHHPEPPPPSLHRGAPCATRALRLTDAVDADALAEQLERLWRAATGRRGPGARVALSVAEPCARTRAERERDAMRLLNAETDRSDGARSIGTLFATLVCLGAREHLLLLVSTAGGHSTDALAATVEGLARLYPLAAIA